MSQRYAPGVRVEIRDAEWRIKCIDHTSDGGELLTCEGLSELVRATSLTKIEPSIRIQLSVMRQYEADLNNGISYVIDNVQRQEHSLVLGCNDIQHLITGDTVSKIYTAPKTTGVVERTIIYQAPIFRPDREEDYAMA